MQTTLLALAVFSVAFIGLAIGVIFTGERGELKGSCGGVGTNPDCCQTCPNKDTCDSHDHDHEAEAADHPLLAQAP